MSEQCANERRLSCTRRSSYPYDNRFGLRAGQGRTYLSFRARISFYMAEKTG